MSEKKYKNGETHFFHPLEIAICGRSGSGKTTLFEKIFARLSKKYSVGYVKHDAHRFFMDHEGKDTFKIRKAGAAGIYICDEIQRAYIGFNQYNFAADRLQFIDYDFVLVEGYKNTNIQKILFLDEKMELWKEHQENPFVNVVGIVGPMAEDLSPESDLPYFHRNNEEGITNFIEGLMIDMVREKPLNGLILTGGQSSRMKTDKSALSYHGMDQAHFAFELMSKHCDEVFVSCRADQRDLPHLKDLPQIHDIIFDQGPTGGIISAMMKYPKASWMVLACDLPFISESALQILVDEFDPFKVATAFVNPVKDWPEPLCTIYTSKARMRFFEHLAIGRNCPRKLIGNSNIKRIHPADPKLLINANTPADYDLVCGEIKQGRRGNES